MAKVAALQGVPLMPWQRYVADVGCELLPNGRFAYKTIIVTVPRQSGKTTLAGPINIERITVNPGGKAWLTAQRRQDARDILMDVIARVRFSPLARLFEIRESNGSESITAPGGGTFRVFAPVEDALHGKTNLIVNCDEIWKFNADQGDALEQAILPTFATTGGQLWLYSTAGTAMSEWLWSYVGKGRAAVEELRDQGIAYFECSLPDGDVEAVEKGVTKGAERAEFDHAIDLIMAAHPATGYTLIREAVEQAAEMMPGPKFLRAYGNRWSSTSDSVIPAHLWAAIRRRAPRPEPGKLGLGFDVSLDRADACLAAAWRADGRLFVDVIEAGAGDGWLIEKGLRHATEWRSQLGYNKAGQALSVADKLGKAPAAPLVPIGSAEWSVACADVLTAITDGKLAHPGDPRLDAAAAVAAIKPQGDGYIWSRRGSAGSIAPLGAITAAVWSLDHGIPALPKPAFYTRKG